MEENAKVGSDTLTKKQPEWLPVTAFLTRGSQLEPFVLRGRPIAPALLQKQ